MKGLRLRCLLGFLVAIALCGITMDAALAQCVPESGPEHGYNTYYHNSGLYPNCIQDYDLDMPEYKGFVSEFSQYLYPPGTPVVADYFGVSCPLGQEAHGYTVERYFEFAYPRKHVEYVENTGLTWAEMIQYIADNYSRGTIANLSNGTLGWERENTPAVEAAYASEVLLVGAPLTFEDAPDHLKDKILTCGVMKATGEFFGTGTFSPPNAAAVGVPTNWYDESEGQHVIADTGLNPGWSNAYMEGGSFSTPLLAGTVQYIADVVLTRGVPPGQFVDKVLDYVISSCDRNVDPVSYEHRTSEALTSFGPWSETWGYGVYSPWKALIYAYGFGRLEAKDAQIDLGGVEPLPIVFSDHYYLRGDLNVPYGQTFKVSPLASLSIAQGASVPEGPDDLGYYPSLHEIHVAGNMEIETSISVPNHMYRKGVCATITIASGGSCTVKNGGLVTIDSGEVLYVLDGGQLDLETGGEIVIMDGGVLCVFGGFNHAGTLTIQPGALVIFGPPSDVYLAADLNIPFNALFIGSYNVTTVASSDAAGAGNDPGRVEITCDGEMDFTGSSSSPATIKGENQGAGEWVGIIFSSTQTVTSNFGALLISDAEVGVDIGGSAPIALTGVTINDCGTGIKVTGRSDISLIGTYVGGEISACTHGVELDQASIDIDNMSIHDNDVGIHCTASSPKVRDCDIYANEIGVATFDSNSIPDLGTIVDPGNNNFHGPNWKYPGLVNDIHIIALDPSSDIYAQKNWWGTTKERKIEERIIVIAGPPPDPGSVIYKPYLPGLPLGGSAPQPGEKEDSRRPVMMSMATHLEQNHPNPFNPATTIRFGLKESETVSLKIYSVSGKLVRTLVEERRGAGNYEVMWDGTNSRGHAVNSGIYFYRLMTKSFIETRKMILLR